MIPTFFEPADYFNNHPAQDATCPLMIASPVAGYATGTRFEDAHKPKDRGVPARVPLADHPSAALNADRYPFFIGGAPAGYAVQSFGPNAAAALVPYAPALHAAPTLRGSVTNPPPPDLPEGRKNHVLHARTPEDNRLTRSLANLAGKAI